MKPSEIIEKYGWCQNAAARDSDGMSIHALSSEATCFCLSGAVQRAFRGGAYPWLVFMVDTKTFLPRGFTSVIVWNDAPGRTKEEVIQLLKSVEDANPGIVFSN
jgi:hypothetical protein